MATLHATLNEVLEMTPGIRLGKLPDRLPEVIVTHLDLHSADVANTASYRFGRNYAQNLSSNKLAILKVMEIELPLASFILSISGEVEEDLLTVGESQLALAVTMLKWFRMGWLDSAWQLSLPATSLITLEESVRFVSQFQRELPDERSTPKRSIIEKWAVWYSAIAYALAARMGHYQRGLTGDKRRIYASWVSAMVSGHISRVRSQYENPSLDMEANEIFAIALKHFMAIRSHKKDFVF
jgi:hypothetical protein